MDIRELKNTLLEFAPTAIEELKKIIVSKGASDKAKLDAITLLFDRVGMPALRASVTQTLVGGHVDLDMLMESKKQLSIESEKIGADLAIIEDKLGRTSKIPVKDVSGSAR